MDIFRTLTVSVFILCSTPLGFGAEFDIKNIFKEFKKKPYIVSKFSQTVYTAALNRTSQAEGNFIYHFPSQSRWDYERPEIQTIIISMDVITIVDPILETVSIRNLKGNVPDSVLFFLSGDESVLKSYTKLKKPLRNVLKCTGEPLYYSATLEDNFIRDIHICYNKVTKFFDSVYILEQNGNYRIFKFTKPQFKPTNLQSFKYAIPKKWEIIRE